MKIAHIIVPIAVTLCGLVGYSLGTGWVRVGPPDHSSVEAPPKNPTNADSSQGQTVPIWPNKGSSADPAVLPAALSIPPIATAINAAAQTHTHKSSTSDAVPVPPAAAPAAATPAPAAATPTPAAATPAPAAATARRLGSRDCAPPQAHRPLPFWECL